MSKDYVVNFTDEPDLEPKLHKTLKYAEPTKLTTPAGAPFYRVKTTRAGAPVYFVTDTCFSTGLRVNMNNDNTSISGYSVPIYMMDRDQATESQLRLIKELENADKSMKKHILENKGSVGLKKVNQAVLDADFSSLYWPTDENGERKSDATPSMYVKCYTLYVKDGEQPPAPEWPEDEDGGPQITTNFFDLNKFDEKTGNPCRISPKIFLKKRLRGVFVFRLDHIYCGARASPQYRLRSVYVSEILEGGPSRVLGTEQIMRMQKRAEAAKKLLKSRARPIEYDMGDQSPKKGGNGAPAAKDDSDSDDDVAPAANDDSDDDVAPAAKVGPVAVTDSEDSD